MTSRSRRTRTRQLDPVVIAAGTDELALLELWAEAIKQTCARAGRGAVPSGLVLLVPLLRRHHRGRRCAPTSPTRRTSPSTCSNSTTATNPPSATGSPPTRSSRAAWLRWSRCDRAGRHEPGHLDRPVPRRARLAGRDRAPRLAGPYLHDQAPQPLKAWWQPDLGWGDGSCTASTRRTPRCSSTSSPSRANWRNMGFTYLKLDFTFAPSCRRHLRRSDPDAGTTRPCRVRRDPPRRRGRRVPARLRRAARARRGRGRRQPDRARRRASVGARARRQK